MNCPICDTVHVKPEAVCKAMPASIRIFDERIKKAIASREAVSKKINIGSGEDFFLTYDFPNSYEPV